MLNQRGSRATLSSEQATCACVTKPSGRKPKHRTHTTGARYLLYDPRMSMFRAKAEYLHFCLMGARPSSSIRLSHS